MEYLPIGFATMVVGFIAVAIGLVILLICINIMSALIRDKTKEDTNDIIAETHKPEPDTTAQQNQDELIDDSALVATITAALCAYMDTGSDKIIVRSIRRARNWNDAVRLENQNKL